MKCLVCRVTADHDNGLLKGVSRSFYLSLRLLPRPMRESASLAYLLARTSDTLADCAGLPAAERIECLTRFCGAVAGVEGIPHWSLALVDSLPDPRERLLLRRSEELLGSLERLPDAQAILVREVLAIITSGQQLDLERFGAADRAHPVTLRNDAELEDYAWRVAGCVGVFWTRLGFLTLGPRFATGSPDVFEARGAAYGKGLQLVNILRDMPADLAQGRCYLPVADPADPGQLAAERGRWLECADAWLGQGHAYAGALVSRRVRAASLLPAMLGRETLARLREAGPRSLETRVKVPRRTVYQLLLRALLAPSPGG
jgi:farnesyl-diphosphate farnesyltransferase